MARSVRELKQESELSRAELAATVDQLKVRIGDTAEDIRNMASPQHIKSEVSDLISQKTQGWVDALKQQAADNPMQTMAVCTAVAVPVLRMARGFSLPLLMMGAGLALTSKTVRDRAADAAAPAMDRARDLTDEAAGRAQSLRSDVASSAAGMADDVRNGVAQAADAITDKLRGGLDAAKDTMQRAQSTAQDAAAAAKEAATAAPAKARQVIGENAALIGGVGIAIGAIIAAALPQTRAEAKVMGQASDTVKKAAGDAAQTGFEAAKGAADAAVRSVGDADLGEHASRMTRNIADTLKDVADDVVTAAFDPSRTPNI